MESRLLSLETSRAGRWVTPAILALAASWKMIFFWPDGMPFNGDEAIVALMARHILQGARPVFFYGQAYMGSLDAWLVAGGFALFGQQVIVIRVVQLLLYLLTILVTIRIGWVAFDSRPVGWLAGLLLAVPAVNTQLYTSASLGGYGEALLIGALLLWVALEARRNPRVWLYGAWGLVAGLGVWANGLTLVFAAPSAVFLAVHRVLRWKRTPLKLRIASIGLTITGFLIGASPWWLDALRQGPGSLLAELTGSAVAVEQSSWLARTGGHLVNLLLGLTAFWGLRPPWEVRWLALPLLPLALGIQLWAGWRLVSGAWRPSPQRAAYRLLAGVAAVLIAGFVFTPFGVDPSGRYFLPLILPLALASAHAILSLPAQIRWRAWIAPVLLLFAGVGTLQCALVNPPGLTTQFYAPSQIDHRQMDALISFLRQQGELRGYTNYWVSYPLAFRSQEELIFVPALPYHPDLSYTVRDNRYAPYNTAVLQSQRVAYINVVQLPEVSEALRAAFRQAQITWQEAQIGDTIVFYRLSRPVRVDFGG